MKEKAKKAVYIILAALIGAATILLACFKRDKDILTAGAASVELDLITENKINADWTSTALGINNFYSHTATIIFKNVSIFPLVICLFASNNTITCTLSKYVDSGVTQIYDEKLKFESNGSKQYIVTEDQATQYRLNLSYTDKYSWATALQASIVSEGYGAGYENGYAAGKAEGKQEGLTEGYNNGFTAGKTEGIEEGKTEGKQEGLTEGYNNGYSAGKTDGYNEGYGIGFNAGKAEGYTEEDLETWYQDGRSDGYQEGYLDGERTGYQDGYDAAIETAQTGSYMALFSALVSAPVGVFTEMLNFEILGINISQLAIGLLSLCLLIAVFKTVTGKG